jgi:iron(II)-dependent oxidoreductase
VSAAESAQMHAPAMSDSQAVLAALGEARAATLALVEHLGPGELERAHSAIMSPLVWDLAHIAAYEDLWLSHRLAGLSLLRPELAERYDAFETPRPLRGEIALLDTAEARGYMEAVRARAAAALQQHGPGDGVICEMVVRHELQHTETMRQAMAIAGLLPAGEGRLAAMTGSPGWATVPAGPFQMGAPAQGFAYDNERPRHRVSLASFQIARQPVSNAGWLGFAEAGGYERREWWSPAGWAWRLEEAITVHPAIAAGDPRAAACHVSWFEADAFARANGARLPSEAEWEKAARCDALEHAGEVWEWTASEFDGYPGFRAHPYREYSEVFFKDGYRVLRGGSWATCPRVANLTFRNWDLPQRRQIFAGLRLARDAR